MIFFVFFFCVFFVVVRRLNLLFFFFSALWQSEECFFFLIYICMDVRKRTSILVTGALLRVGVLQVLCCVSKSACSFCLTGLCACTHTVLTFILAFFFLSDGVSFPFFCSYIYIYTCICIYIFFMSFFFLWLHWCTFGMFKYSSNDWAYSLFAQRSTALRIFFSNKAAKQQ